jgi:hypothetical protein
VVVGRFAFEMLPVAGAPPGERLRNSTPSSSIATCSGFAILRLSRRVYAESEVVAMGEHGSLPLVREDVAKSAL